jgi:hypothetical protein
VAAGYARGILTQHASLDVTTTMVIRPRAACRPQGTEWLGHCSDTFGVPILQHGEATVSVSVTDWNIPIHVAHTFFVCMAGVQSLRALQMAHNFVRRALGLVDLTVYL